MMRLRFYAAKCTSCNEDVNLSQISLQFYGAVKCLFFLIFFLKNILKYFFLFFKIYF